MGSFTAATTINVSTAEKPTGATDGAPLGYSFDEVATAWEGGTGDGGGGECAEAALVTASLRKGALNEETEPVTGGRKGGVDMCGTKSGIEMGRQHDVERQRWQPQQLSQQQLRPQTQIVREQHMRSKGPATTQHRQDEGEEPQTLPRKPETEPGAEMQTAEDVAGAMIRRADAHFVNTLLSSTMHGWNEIASLAVQNLSAAVRRYADLGTVQTALETWRERTLFFAIKHRVNSYRAIVGVTRKPVSVPFSLWRANTLNAAANRENILDVVSAWQHFAGGVVLKAFDAWEESAREEAAHMLSVAAAAAAAASVAEVRCSDPKLATQIGNMIDLFNVNLFDA